MARAIKTPPTATGPLLVDKTGADPTLPADLAALEAAYPAAGEPSNEQWAGSYGASPAIVRARVEDVAGTLTWVADPVAASDSDFVGASAVAGGSDGNVPAPATAQQDLVLHGVAMWRQIAPSWTANTDYSQGAFIFQNAALRRRRTAGTSGLFFDATEEADWETLAQINSGSRTVHNFAGPVTLDRIDGSYQGELHVEAGNAWNLDADVFNDGDWFYAVNTSGVAVPSALTPTNFAAAFVRDGNSTPIVGGFDLGSAIDARWVITVTENGGNKFLNVYPFGTTPEPERFIPTTAGANLDVGERWMHQVGHITNLPATSAANDGQFITLSGAEPWGAAMGAADWIPAGADTLNYPAGGLPADSVDIVTLISNFATNEWLVRVGGQPTLLPDLQFDTVALLPDPATVPAGTQASVTDDGALSGVYVATGPGGGPGDGWVRS